MTNIHDIWSGAGSIAGAASGWSSLSTGAQIAIIIGGIVLVIVLVLGVRRYRSNDSTPAPRLDPRMLNARNCTGFQHRDKSYRHTFDDAPDDEWSLSISRLDPRCDDRLVPDMASIASLPALRPARLPTHRPNTALDRTSGGRHAVEHLDPVNTEICRATEAPMTATMHRVPPRSRSRILTCREGAHIAQVATSDRSGRVQLRAEILWSSR